MAISISASVGSKGANRYDDVVTVQRLLNCVPPLEGGPSPAIAVDGLVGPRTIGAISRFQQHQFGWADGRVDPGQRTITKLNDFYTGPDPAIVQAVEAVLDLGQQLLSYPGAPRFLGYAAGKLPQILRQLGDALAKYRASASSAAMLPTTAPVYVRPGLTLKELQIEFAKYRAATGGQGGPLVGAAVVDDLAWLWVILFLILVNWAMRRTIPGVRKGEDERAQELDRMLERLRDMMRSTAGDRVREKKEEIATDEANIEECEGQHPDQEGPCAEKKRIYDEAKDRYRRKLFDYENCLKLFGCAQNKVNKYYLEHLKNLYLQYRRALQDLKDCLGCANF